MTLIDLIPTLALGSAGFTIALLISRLTSFLGAQTAPLAWQDWGALGASSITIALIGLSLLSLR